MDDRDKQRNARREEAGCQDPIKIPPFKTTPLRVDKDCDPVSNPPLPDKFFKPNICPPEPTPALVIPRPLVIGNDEVTVDCPLVPEKPGTIGASVTIDADTFTDVFNFGSVPNINSNQLTAISGLSDTQRTILTNTDTTVTVIAAITHLNLEQATFIKEQVTAIKINVDLTALTSAEGQITCIFLNVPQSVTCLDAGFPVDAYTNSNIPVGEDNNVNNPSSVAGNVYASPNSQEEADEIANSVARAGLKCHYGNDEVTVTCANTGFSEEIPNDVLPATSSDGRLRVGSFTVEADTIFSNLGRDVATELATTLAESQLVCFYLNEAVSMDCEGVGKEGTVATPADVTTGTSGNPVTVPAGFLQSTISTVDATEQATLLAESLLECYWVNSEKCKSCPIETVVNPDDPDGPPFYVTAQDAGPRCIPAGTVRSYVSKADADAQAEILAQAQLICIYCNPTIYPKCAPESWSGIIPVPPEEIDSTWSISATRGAANNTICSTNASDVIGVAVSIGNTVADITDANDCCYGNDAVTASCENDDMGNPPDVTLSSEDVTIAANTLIVCDSDASAAGWAGTTKAYATQLAQQLANAALVCIWSNTLQNVSCPLPGGDDIVFGNSSAFSGAGLYISFKSQAEADSLAETVALAQLNCIYSNYGGEGSGSGDYPGSGGGNCSSGETFLGQPTIAQGAVPSGVSSAAASIIAQAMSDAAAVCANNDLLGPPGNDGAQTNCNGNCYGYFS